MSTHAERCQRESTRDVVFLLQRQSLKESNIWLTEGVWLDRTEAESFAKDHEYNYPHGWRVYGVPSYGELAALLKAQDTALTTNH